jgi:hypothetical protein
MSAFLRVSLGITPGGKRTVWLLMLGCQILVSSDMCGDLNGYWSGMVMSTLYEPPA